MVKRSSVTEALDKIAEELERCQRKGAGGGKTPSSKRITEALDKIADEVKEGGNESRRTELNHLRIAALGRKAE
ncbi:MAG: hypothetical protein LC802_22760 [Acidobacteria bacterium]|nr:hypothetical protein [Acidobacteriota bacterium]